MTPQTRRFADHLMEKARGQDVAEGETWEPVLIVDGNALYVIPIRHLLVSKEVWLEAQTPISKLILERQADRYALIVPGLRDVDGVPHEALRLHVADAQDHYDWGAPIERTLGQPPVLGGWITEDDPEGLYAEPLDAIVGVSLN